MDAPEATATAGDLGASTISLSMSANRNATARTHRTRKFTFSMPVISRWTRLQMKSPSWSEDLSLLHVQDFWRGKPAELVSRFGGARLREWLLRKNVRK